MVDVASGDVVERYRPPVDALSNPAWSPDGCTIAFTGTSAGLHDLYLLDEVAPVCVRRDSRVD